MRRSALAVALIACADPAATPDATDRTVGDASGETDAPEAPDSPCPTDMVAVDGAFCVDRYEASLEERVDGAWRPAATIAPIGDRVVRARSVAGVKPQAYVSADQAEAACAAAGKRLCTSPEWLAACQGPEEHTWPYGDARVDGACHDTYAGGHPVVDWFGTNEGVWDAAHMNDPGIDTQPGTLAETGSYAGCVSAWGTFDQHGNVHEWVADPEGTFRGGFFADGAINGPGCTYVTTAHDRAWSDYSTGFRCCADLAAR